MLSAIDRAVNLGQLSPEEAGRIQGDDILAMRLAAGQPVSEIQTAAAPIPTPEALSAPGLQEPHCLGVSLRANED